MGNLTAIPPFLFLGRKNDSFCTIMLALSHNILYSTFKDGGKFQLELEILLSNEYVLFFNHVETSAKFCEQFRKYEILAKIFFFLACFSDKFSEINSKSNIFAKFSLKVRFL
jgi:hypothetical protein